MPADDCPSFHCRPSTASTFLPLSFSIRQKPTTGTSDFGSAPTVSPERSIVDCAARLGKIGTTRPIATTIIGPRLLLPVMMNLLRQTRQESTADGGSTT